jgi:hypothetical protein
MQNPSLPFRAEREGPAAEPWEGEVGASASALESPTSPQPSPPPGAERELPARTPRILRVLCGEAFLFSLPHRLTGEQKGSPMTLLVKDANTSVQSLSTVTDGSGNLVPAHAPASTNAQGIAAPVGPQNPLPVVNTAGNAASDGSGTLAAGGSAQTLFGGAVPANGYLVQNNSSAALWISDTGAASNGGASIQLAPNGGIFMTPSGYKPAGPVSLFGATTGQGFAARRW